MRKSYLLVLAFFLFPTSFSGQKTVSLELPFFEDWSSGFFETNNWTTECSNWTIQNQSGNEKPCAEFAWDPQLQNDYNCSLVSDEFQAELLDIGEIFLEFDIYLKNRNGTGTEVLEVEVFDGNNWHIAAEYANNSDIDWSGKSINITQYALGTNFRIRFNLTGENSFNFIYWDLDNISVYRKCHAPYYLDGAFYWENEHDWGAELFWKGPESAVLKSETIIHWGNLENYSGIGMLSNQTFSPASHWNPDELHNYVGDTLKSIKLLLHQEGVNQLKANIWMGENGDSLVYERSIENIVYGSWIEHELDTLILIEEYNHYRVGYTLIGQQTGTFPAGIDKGPALVGKGDLVLFENTNWEKISDYGFDNNFNIQMKLVNNDTTSKCLGYNIFRMAPDETEYELYDFVSHLDTVSEYSYRDSSYVLYICCYQVNAVWASQEDTCVSDYGSSIIPIYDYICIGLHNIDDPTITSDIRLFPNPAKSNLKIKSTESISSLRIYNNHGQLIAARKNIGEESIIDVSSLNKGMYILQIKLKEKVVHKRFLKVD